MKQNINITINFPIDTSNLNGTIYTCDAVQRAFQEAQTKKLPIVDYISDKKKVVGVATPVSCCLVDDYYLIDNDCFMFYGDTIKKLDIDFMINDFHRNKDNMMVIDDFRIVSMSIYEDEI